MRGRFGFGFLSYRGAPRAGFSEKTKFMLCVESESDPSGKIILESRHKIELENHQSTYCAFL